MAVLTKITSRSLADNAVTSAHVQADVIAAGDIADDAVGTAELANDLSISTSGNLTTSGTGLVTSAGRSVHSGGITIAAAGNVTVSQALTVTGDLTVNGTNTTVNSTTLQIDDKHIELAHSPSGSEGADASIDGGGIILKSSDSDKSIQWYDATDAWTFNQHLFPSADNASDLGAAAKRWRNIYTADLHLSNREMTNDVDGTWGEWVIQEGFDDLFIINKRTLKKYKFNLTEVDPAPEDPQAGVPNDERV